MAMQKCLVSMKFLKPDAGGTAISQKLFVKPDAGGTAISEKLFVKPDYTTKAKKFDSGDIRQTGQVFVLSNKPVLGRNCIVISSGFADLMDGLQTAGGARVTVA
jgi:hypothetical protein